MKENISQEKKNTVVLEQKTQNIENTQQNPLNEQEINALIIGFENDAEQRSREIINHKEEILNQGLESLHESNPEIELKAKSLTEKFKHKISELKESVTSKIKTITTISALVGVVASVQGQESQISKADGVTPTYSVVDKQTKFIVGADGKTKVPYVERHIYTKSDNKVSETQKLDPVTLTPLPFEGVANQFREGRKEFLDTDLASLKKTEREYAESEYDSYIKSDYAQKLMKSNNPSDKEELQSAINWLKEDQNTVEKDVQDSYDRKAKVYNQFDKEKEWLAKNIASSEYKKRATQNEDLTQDEIKSRMRRVENFDYSLDEMLAYQGTNAVTRNPETGDISSKISVNPRYFEPGTMIHEGQHASTNNLNNMSEYAKDLYQKAFTPEGSEDFANSIWPSSFESRHFSELDARKKMTEYFLEQQGIKKYNEPFTQEHYRILKKMTIEHPFGSEGYKEALPVDVREFLRDIKPEYIEKIMNTIAQNDDSQENSAEQQNLSIT